MVELKAKVTKGGLLYIPKEIRDAFGRKMRVVANACAAVVFPDFATYEDVLASLKVISADLEHRAKLAQKTVKKEEAVNG